MYKYANKYKKLNTHQATTNKKTIIQKNTLKLVHVIPNTFAHTRTHIYN